MNLLMMRVTFPSLRLLNPLSVLLVCGVWLASTASEAGETVLPEEAIQRIYSSIIKQPEENRAARQFAKDLRELTKLCRLAKQQLAAGDNAEETCHLIESKAEELKRDRKLLEHHVNVWKTRPRAKHRTAALIDPEVATKRALDRLTILQAALDKLPTPATHETDDSHRARTYDVRNALTQILSQVEPSKPTPPEAPAPPQPTFVLYEPKPRAPRERGTIIPAYLQPQGSSSPPQKTSKPQALLSLAMPDAEAAGTGAPTAADLQATLDAPLTPEIQTVAAQLGHSAAAIYEYVKNQTEFESYYGSLKGAQATLWSRRGNDVDQASLLIALLRASGIPCRYVQGTVRIPVQQAMNWLGMKTPEGAKRILLAGHIPADDYGQNQTIKMEHMWVEAFVPYGYYRGVPQDPSAGQWIPLDPSIKEKTYQPGLQVFSSVPFDEARYLAKRQRELPTDLYEEQLIAYLSQSFPGRSVTEVGYDGTIVPEQLQVLPSTLPIALPVVAFLGEYAELPANLRNTVELELLTADETTALLRTTLVLPEVILKRVTLSYPQGVGGLVPTVKVDGSVRSTGPARPLGEAHHLKFRITIPNTPVEDISQRETLYPNILAGEYYAIGLDGHQSSPLLLEQRINRMLDHQSTIGSPQEDPDEITGEFLNFSLLLYFRNVGTLDKLVEEFAHVRDVVGPPQIGVSRAKLTIEQAFDLPFTIAPDGLGIDIRRSLVSITPIDGAEWDDQKWYGRIISAFHMRSVQLSALEHTVWEELVKIESVSTVKGLQFANENGIPILTITPANLTQMLGLLDSVPAERRITPQWRQTLVNHLSGAAPADSFMMPQEKLFYNDWKGSVGFVLYRQTELADAYLIEGGLAGGATTLLERIRSAAEKFLDTITGALHSFFDGDPVNIANGNLVHTETDFTIQSRGLPLRWKRVYNSKLNYDGPLGFGWVHFYDVHLTEQPDGSVVFLDDDGGQRIFTRNVDGSYTPPPGMYLTLTKLSDGFSMRDKSGLLYRFRSDGKLASLEDPNGNKTTLTYDGTRLIRVTDALGRSLTLSYNGQGKIASVEDFTSRRWSYTYDGDGNLTAVNDPLEQPMRYEYYTGQFNPDNNHNIKKIIDREGHATTFLYYTNDRVFKHMNDLGETRTFSYNVLWQETTVINETGFTKTFKYDDQGNLIKLVEETGAIWRYTWDGRHNRLSDTDPLGNVTTYTYDDMGNVLTVDDPLNPPVLYTYESIFSKRTSTTDARGFRTTWEYDAKSNLKTITDALTQLTSFEYDAYGNRTAQTDARRVRTTFTYNSLDRLIERRIRVGTVDVITTFEYDALGRLMASTDPNGHRTSWTYDLLDRVTDVTKMLDASTPVKTTFTYDKDGRPLSVTDAEGRKTTSAYDAAGRRATTTDALSQATQLRYDGLGNVISMVATNGATTQFTYDGKGNRMSTINPLQQASTVRYNLLDHVVASTDPNNNTTSFEYDALQRLTSTTDAAGNITRFGYDPNGNRTELTDAEGRLTKFAYDPLNRLIQVTDPLRGVTDYGYDEVGNLVRVTNALGNATRQEFDELNRVTASIDPLSNRWKFGYDGVGNRTSVTDPTGQVISFRYDALDRLIEKTLPPDGALVTYGYDKIGNQTRTQLPNVTVTYQYDRLNRLIEAQDSRMTKPITYTYDPVGNRTAMTDTEGFTTKYQVDPADRLIRIEDPFGGQTRYAYDAGGRRISRESPNHVVSLSTYDTANRLTALEIKHALTGNVIDRFSYTHDRVGNRLTMNNPQGQHRYAYDELDRLTAAAYPDGFSEAFVYDAVGNRLRKTDPSGVTEYSYDTANRLLQEGSTIHAYDANGNLISSTTGDQVRSYRYDAEQHLIKVEDDSSVLATYAYDAEGRRIEKAVGSGIGTQRTRYLYDGQQILAEYSATNALKARYVHGAGIDEVLLMVRGGRISALHQDGLGSVIAATDPRGVVAEAYRYRAFGEGTVLAPDGTARAASVLGTPFRFTGREWDEETGLSYYRNRYYQQTVGRFLTVDRFPGSPTDPSSWHRYSYVGNNPINRLDPYGLIAEAAEIPKSRLDQFKDYDRGGWDDSNSKERGRGATTMLLPGISPLGPRFIHQEPSGERYWSSSIRPTPAPTPPPYMKIANYLTENPARALRWTGRTIQELSPPHSADNFFGGRAIGRTLSITGVALEPGGTGKITGMIAGGSMGALAGSKFGTWGAIGGGILGGMAGASGGSLFDSKGASEAE